MRFRPYRLHPAEGEVTRPASKLSISLIVGATVLLIAAVIFMPELGVIATIAQLLLALAAVVGAVFAGARIRRRVNGAEAALREAAEGDPFWSPDAIRTRVELLFEPYWRAVQRRNVGVLAVELSPCWRRRLEEAFSIWHERGFKPVLFNLALNKVELLEVDDQSDPAADRFVALVECTTSYHVTDTRTGDVVEGFPDSRVERQAWQFIRGEQQWLLDRVERLGHSGGSDSGFDFFSDGNIDCTS